jgi:hypothetical protein
VAPRCKTWPIVPPSTLGNRMHHQRPGLNTYGVALWPLLGVEITHQGPGMICKGPYPVFELATVGLLYLKDWEQVAANVEIVEEPFGRKRIRLKSPPLEAPPSVDSRSQLLKMRSVHQTRA